MKTQITRRMFASACVVAAALALVPGCERKEKVLGIETPDGEIGVERDKSSGDGDVEVNDKE